MGVAIIQGCKSSYYCRNSLYFKITPKISYYFLLLWNSSAKEISSQNRSKLLIIAPKTPKFSRALPLDPARIARYACYARFARTSCPAREFSYFFRIQDLHPCSWFSQVRLERGGGGWGLGSKIMRILFGYENGLFYPFVKLKIFKWFLENGPKLK